MFAIATQDASASIMSSCLPFGNLINSNSISFTLFPFVSWYMAHPEYLGCKVDLILDSFSPDGFISYTWKNFHCIRICFFISNASIFWN